MITTAKVFSNKRGMYEFILTKSIMLVFILGLVGIFVSFYNTMSHNSADEIANSEAERIAKQIDDIIGFKGVSNTATVHLSRELYVGKDTAPYKLEITDTGVVVISFVQYPYQDVNGVAQFGLRINKVSGSPDKLDCDWTQISNGASFVIEKESVNWYSTTDQKLHYNVSVDIDATDSCGEDMKFFEDFAES